MVQELAPKTTAESAMLRGLQRSPTHSAVLLYSAGADSTAAGVRLKEEGLKVFPMYVDYGQTSRDAEEYLVKLASPKLGFERPKIVKTDVLQQLSESTLLGGTAKDDTQAWVPGRNSLFLLMGGIYAQQIDADGVAIGFMLEDSGVFGDSNFTHHKTLELLLHQTLTRPMEVFLPVMKDTKLSVLTYLHERGIIDLTVSCWNATIVNGQVLSCHACANCEERDKAINMISVD